MTCILHLACPSPLLTSISRLFPTLSLGFILPAGLMKKVRDARLSHHYRLLPFPPPSTATANSTHISLAGRPRKPTEPHAFHPGQRGRNFSRSLSLAHK